jgi:hypothetical protein
MTCLPSHYVPDPIACKNIRSSSTENRASAARAQATPLGSANNQPTRNHMTCEPIWHTVQYIRVCPQGLINNEGLETSLGKLER